MAEFPDTDLDLLAEAAFGADLTADPATWAWTDLSDRLLDSEISIRRGTSAGAGNSQTTTATGLRLLNEDGWLTPMHAGSPYWPYVDAGAPIRIGVRPDADPLYSDTFSRSFSPGWNAADSGHTYVHGSGTSGDFSINGSAGLMSLSATNVTRRAVSSLNVTDADVTFDVAVSATASGVALVAGVFLRYQDSSNHVWATVEFQTTGAIQVKARTTVAGVATSLGQVTVPGLTYSPGAAVRARVIIQGDVLRMRAWTPGSAEPVTWPLSVTQTAWTGAGRVGFQSWVLTGSTNTLPVVFSYDNVAARTVHTPRVEGYITDVQPTFLPQSDGTTFSTVQVGIGGVGSRLEKQEAPALSPMRRSIQQATQTPIAYWPLEDDAGSTYAVSAFPGGPRMTVTGPAVFGFDQGTPTDQYLTRYGTKPMASVAAGARLTAAVPVSAVTSEWAVSLVAEFYAPDVPAITEMRIMQWDTPSSALNRWAFVATNTGYVVRAYNDSAGTVTDVATYSGVFQGQATYTVEASQSGGNVSIGWYVNDNLLASGTIAGTMAPVTRIAVNPSQVNTTASVTPAGLKFVVGHVRVVDETSVHDTPFYAVPETGTVVTAIKSWYNEPAHRRIERLCDEERVPITLLGDPATTGYTVLGAQQEGGFSDLIQSAAESESGGLLYEAGFGYAYLPRSARYNLPVALTVDLATYCRSESTDQADVLVPQLDSRAANYWTVRRADGAEGSYAADAAYRARRGTIAQEVTLDVLRDSDTDLHAQWRVHVGTDARDAYYPGLPLDLAANPDLIDDWLGCSIGSRVQRLNQPTIAGEGTIDQVIDGYTETLGPRTWQVEIDASPASVWDVAVYGQAVYSPSSSTLQADITSSATSMSVGGETWVTGAVSLLLEIDGEHISVSNISGTGPYTMTISARSVNGVVAAHSAGAAVHLANPARYGL